MMRRLLAAWALSLALAPVAHTAGPAMAFGISDDFVRAPDLVSAKAKLSLLRLAGFTAVGVTSQWQPGATAPADTELRILDNVVGAAQLSGIRIYLSVYPSGSGSTPLTPEAREQFAAYATVLVQRFPYLDDVIVGNEPNIDRFWLPQFNPDGSDAAAPAYLALLTRTYDAIKAIDPTVRVWGGALAPRGVDRLNTGQDTHSPGLFLQDMGAAYRAAGRTLPVMDGLAFHPYASPPGQSPETPHPRSTTIGLADYDRLLGSLAQAFDGTAQPGFSLPVLYDQYGVESRIPPGKARAYTGQEEATTKPVSETTQAQYYGRVLQLAFCQPNVAGIVFSHMQDDPSRGGLQSGVYYADGTPKSSLWAVRDALARARGGSIARCDGLTLDVQPVLLRFPTQAELSRRKAVVQFICSLDCAWEVRAVRVASGAGAARLAGYRRAGVPIAASFRGRKFGSGQIRFTLTLSQPINPGAPTVRESGILAAG